VEGSGNCEPWASSLSMSSKLSCAWVGLSGLGRGVGGIHEQEETVFACEVSRHDRTDSP
jgi:hypothetical protein